MQIVRLPDGKLLITDLGTIEASDVLEFYDYEAGGASAVLTGTVISAGADESEIVTGGKTIIITLTDDTWVATVGADNAITEALIAGIDSDGAEATGWDAVVKANMDYNDVVRDVDNVTVTITLGAEAAYAITADETITVTIPATALTLGEAVVATPTFDITNESVATGAIMNQLQGPNLGSDLFNGSII